MVIIFASDKKTVQSKSSFGQLISPTQDQSMDELLGLCSGQFTGGVSTQFGSTGAFTVRNEGEDVLPTQRPQSSASGVTKDTSSQSSFAFSDTSIPVSQNIRRQDSNPLDSSHTEMNELLGLCSGRFSGQNKEQRGNKESEERFVSKHFTL